MWYAPPCVIVKVLVATPDGRIVIAVKERDTDTNVLTGNRIRWCSHLEPTDWLGENAGFDDLATATAEIRALSRVGETLTVYFEDSIFLGIPTGQQHQPYGYVRSKSMVGTRWYRAVSESPHGNLFVGSDGNFWLFDGDSAVKLTDETIRKYIKGPDQEYVIGETVSEMIASLTLSAVAPTVTIA